MGPESGPLEGDDKGKCKKKRHLHPPPQKTSAWSKPCHPLDVKPTQGGGGVKIGTWKKRHFKKWRKWREKYENRGKCTRKNAERKCTGFFSLPPTHPSAYRGPGRTGTPSATKTCPFTDPEKKCSEQQNRRVLSNPPPLRKKSIPLPTGARGGRGPSQRETAATLRTAASCWNTPLIRFV